jgi:antitoxin component YwqK of YwqJK toxin-antitoxin module
MALFNSIPIKTSQVFLALALVWWIPCCTNTSSKVEERVDKYPSGITSRTYKLINGKKEGLMTDYYPKGQLLSKRLFKNDLQHGVSNHFYESGAKKEVQYFINGKREGGDTVWFESGKIRYIFNFKNDLREGPMKTFDENGKLVLEVIYEKDQPKTVNGEPLKK